MSEVKANEMMLRVGKTNPPAPTATMMANTIMSGISKVGRNRR